jgi:RNA polymerase sigma-70 factor (ECF subfamily)
VLARPPPRGAERRCPMLNASRGFVVNADTDCDRHWRTFEVEAMPHVDRLFRHAMWLERNRSNAEDLVQETLSQALQSFHRFTPGTNCRAWLLSIMQHVRANRQRKRGAIIESSVDERAADIVPFVPPIPDGVTDEDMLLALEQIPPHHQEVILLCDVEEMTYKEIAAALGIPIGTVMSRLHRGRELLRTELARRGAGPVAVAEGSGIR